MIALFNPSIKQDEYYHLDLSIKNEELNKFDIFNPREMSSYIKHKLAKDNSRYAIGGYLETRNIYKKSGHFDGVGEDRNIHLGIDLWAGSGEMVYCPWKGKIHSYQNNDISGDYGPSIILEHQLKEERFYTLYGHLSLDSLSNKEEGQEINAREVFCSIGDSSINGGYAPHLHFQIIRELHGKKGDYPGVCKQSDLSFYRKNCPDPMKYLNFSS